MTLHCKFFCNFLKLFYVYQRLLVIFYSLHLKKKKKKPCLLSINNCSGADQSAITIKEYECLRAGRLQ